MTCNQDEQQFPSVVERALDWESGGLRPPHKVTIKQSDSSKLPVFPGTQLPHLPNAYPCECGDGWVS